MTVEELMDILEDLDPETEVRVAFQPSWPFEYSLGPETAIIEETEDEPGILYLESNTQIGYLPGEVAREIGWGRE